MSLQDNPRRVSRDNLAEIDRGWAWVVLLGTTAYTFILMGTVRSFGIIHMELVDLFQAEASVTGLIPSTFNVMLTLTSLVAGAMTDRFSARKMVMISGFLASMGVVLTTLAPNLSVAIFTYGVITGSSCAFVGVPTLAALNKYFCKHRALANGIAFAGGSLGNLVVPPLLRLIIDEYAIRGGLLILGGVWMNFVAVGALIRPPPLKADLEDSKRNPKPKTAPENGGLHGDSHDVSTIIDDVDQSRDGLLEKKFDWTSRHTPDGIHPLNNGTAYQSKPNTSWTVDIDTEYNKKTANTSSRCCVSCASKLHCFEKGGDNSEKDVEICARLRGSGMCRLLSNVAMLRTLLMVFLVTFGFSNDLFILPSLVAEIGESKFKGSLLLSIAGGTELVFRFVFGYLADRPNIKATTILKISCAVCGVVGLVLSFLRGYWALGVLATTLGALGGNYMPLLGPILMEMVGANQVGAAMGLAALPMGIGGGIGPPLMGWVKEWSGSYYNAARFCAVSFLLALIVYCIEPNLLRTYSKCPWRHHAARRNTMKRIPDSDTKETELSL